MQIDTNFTSEQRSAVVKLMLAVKMMYYAVGLTVAYKAAMTVSLTNALYEFHFNQDKMDIFSKFGFFQYWEGSSNLDTLVRGYQSERSLDLFPGMPILLNTIFKVTGIKTAADEPTVIAGVFLICSVFINIFLHYLNASLLYKLAKLSGCYSDHAFRICLVLLFSSSSVYHIGLFPDSLYLFAVLMAMCKLKDSQINYGSVLAAPLSNYIQVVGWLAFACATSKSGIFNFIYLLPTSFTLESKKDSKSAPFQLSSSHYLKSLIGVFLVLAPWGLFTVWSFVKFCSLEPQDDSLERCSNTFIFILTSVFWTSTSLNSPWYLYWLSLTAIPIVLHALCTSFNISMPASDKPTVDTVCSQSISNQRWVLACHSVQAMLQTTQAGRSMAGHFYYYFMLDEHQEYYYRRESPWQVYAWLSVIGGLYVGPVLYACQIAQF